jgi:hypothetical protein
VADQSKPEGLLRTKEEQEAARAYARLFSSCPDSLEEKLASFPKYIRRQDLARLLARYEIFKKVLDTKGSIIECGVFRGFGLMAWANFSAILEPANLTRRIYGFDTFGGFRSVGEKDRNRFRTIEEGELRSDAYDELSELVRIYDSNRFLGHVRKVELVKGDARKTIPEFIERNPHLVVSLLFLDFDLYEPTKVAIEHFLSRMPKGAIIAFDELDNPIWPGETLALLETVGIKSLSLQRLAWDPYIGYAVLG